MKITDIPIPEIYLESSDFRFFLRWFDVAISKIRYDTENVLDLLDPQRCPEHLLWMLADSMGYKYDSRLSPAFCRLVLLYFMSMIKYKGSKSGVTLAAEVNLAQFNLIDYEKEKDILHNRLEDTSIPVNSVYVTAHTPEGFIDVVYFSDKKPVDACIEYVRPLGMYCFQHAGVSFNARTRITIDARLTNIKDWASGEGLTRVGHYSREDYARMQKMKKETKKAVKHGSETEYEGPEINTQHTRLPAWNRNQPLEDLPVELGGLGGPSQDAGYRALYSLQMSNSEHITKSLLGPIFDLNYEPQDISVEPYSSMPAADRPMWNLRYDKTEELKHGTDIFTPRNVDGVKTVPQVNPIMSEIGDAILMNIDTQEFTSNVKKGQSFTITSELPVCRIIECKYGSDGSWTLLKLNTDYTVSDQFEVTLSDSSSIIPSSPDSSKKLRITYNFDNNHYYTEYSQTIDPQTGKPVGHIDVIDVSQ